jgi:hypothetical protein
MKYEFHTSYWVDNCGVGMTHMWPVEPFAGRPGVGGVRLEENVVRPDAPEILGEFLFEESLFD